MIRNQSTALSVLFVLFVILLMGSTAYAQPGTQNPPTPVSPEEVLKNMENLRNLVSFLGQRGGGARGALPTPQGAYASALSAGLSSNSQPSGAWWANPAMVQRLGLTDDQKAKIERAFENHRQRIVSNAAVLEKEEAQLARLLEAETIDRNAVFAQIDRVTQARSEMERENAAMTFEMREQLTRAQWIQLQNPLQVSQRVRVGANVVAANLISQVEPAYPESARQAGIQGPVVLEAEISKEGVVDNLTVVSGNLALTQAAVSAVRQWRYRPILLNGAPVAVVTSITVNFPFTAGAPAPAQGGGQRRGGRGQQ